MLTHSKKQESIIYFVIISVMLIILIIILDIFVFKIYSYNNNYKINKNLRSSYVKEFSYVKNKNIANNIININDLCLETMQMGFTINNEEKIEEEKQKIITNKDEANKWRIIIPKINLDAPIQEGTSQAILAKSVGHFEGTSIWNGNISLAGHNRGKDCNFFQNIKELVKGDIIIYSTETGEKKYKVIMNKIIKQTNWDYVENTEDNRITLITCVENMFEYRRCVQALEI